MKILKTLVALIVLGTMGLGMASCGAPTNKATAENQVATVKRGNLTLDITAAGNLAFTHTQDLAIDLFYPTGTKGTIASVLVEAGDTVKEGEVLVTLDTDEWNNQLKIVKTALDTAQRNVITQEGKVTDAKLGVSTAQNKITSAENGITKAEYQVEADQLAVQKAELNLESANNTLMEIAEVKKIQDEIDNDTQTLDFIKQILSGVAGGGLEVSDLNYWYNLRTATKQDMAIAQEDLKDALTGKNLSISTDIALQIEQQQYQVEQCQLLIKNAQITLDDDNLALNNANLAVDIAKHDLETAQQDLENAKLDLTDAQSTVTDAQTDYDNAMSLSPEIKAPFDGFVTQVNVAGGDEVLNGTVAVTIADPNKFEAEILVSEMDISQVKLDGAATVTADANTAVAFPARVTHIAPTATIQSGVVNYTVKVELNALQSVSQNQTTPAATGNATTSTLSPMLQRAVDSGRMTQEQAEQIMKNGPSEGFSPSGNFTEPSGNFTLPEGSSFPSIPGFGRGSQVATASSDFQLREGLTVTVNIIVANEINVLLVPNGAVITEGAQKYVTVVGANGTEEKRAVKTGISNWQYTEITDGLTEGEQVVVSQTTTTTTNSSNTRGGMGFFGPPGR
jgi:HlyD family secretion protein